MKRLYYATFEKGFDIVVKSVIKKLDKNARIKTLYLDAVLFFADEHFKMKNTCFTSAYIVLHNSNKTGVGALNFEIKSILEKKDLKIGLSKTEPNFKISYQKENENVLVDDNLKNALEIMLKKSTKKSISFFAKEELVVLSKADGENLFMRKLDIGAELSKLEKKYGIQPQTAYLLSFMSNPEPNEVVLDPFSNDGVIVYARSLCFHKANVIANDVDQEKTKYLKKLAKTLKEKSFSVLNYDFLQDNFPIRFIDKILTDLTNIGYGAVDTYKKFFQKVFDLKVKTVVVVTNRNFDIEKFVLGKFEIETKIKNPIFDVYKLKLHSK